jgi:hypothetical protein
MGQLLSNEQPPSYQLSRYSMSSSYDREKCDSEVLQGIFLKIIHDILIYFAPVHLKVLKQVCKRLLVIIECRPSPRKFSREFSKIPLKVPRETFDCRQTPDEMGQTPYELKGYSMNSSSLMSPSNNSQECYSKEFTNIPIEMIIYIASELDYFNIRAFECVCKHILEIIRLKWPPVSQDCFRFSLNTMFKCTLERDFYRLCRELRKEKAIIFDNPNSCNMRLRHYLGAEMTECLSPFDIMRPSQWKVIMLKGETCCIRLKKFWLDYLEKCINLFYLTLVDAKFISLCLKNLKRLKGFFIKLNSVGGCGATITLPPSVNEIVVYVSICGSIVSADSRMHAT